MAPTAARQPAKPRAFGELVRQLWTISKAFFGSEVRYKALGFVLVLLALALSVGGVQVLMSYVARYFMTAIATWRSSSTATTMPPSSCRW